MVSEEREFVSVDFRVECHESEIVSEGLADEETVEGIAMDEREFSKAKG
jgi:hypothetical protein